MISLKKITGCFALGKFSSLLIKIILNNLFKHEFMPNASPVQAMHPVTVKKSTLKLLPGSPRPTSKKPEGKSKIKVYDPVIISKNIAPPNDHFIFYPTPGGYCFALFYRDSDEDPFEMVAASHKAYKLKIDCIRTMKKVMYGFGSSTKVGYIRAYSHKGEKISLEIKYDVKKLL